MGTPDPADILVRLQSDVRVGAITLDGRVVGIWFDTMVSGDDGCLPVTQALFRSTGNRPAGVALTGPGDPSAILPRMAVDPGFVSRGAHERQPIGSGSSIPFTETLLTVVDAVKGTGSGIGGGPGGLKARIASTILACRPDAPDVDGLMEALTRKVLDDARPILESFLATLDPIALKVLDTPAGRDLTDAAWVALDTTFDPRGPLARGPLARVAREAPHLFEPLSMVWRMSPEAFTAEADLAGLAGDFVTATLKLPRWVASRFVEASTEYHAWRRRGDPSTAIDRLLMDDEQGFTKQLGHLARLPPSWAPRAGGWDAFFDAHAVRAATSHWTSPRLWADLLRVGGRWGEWNARLSRMARHGPGDDPQDVADAVGDAGDIAYALANQVLTPAHALASAGAGAGRPPLRTLHRTAFSLIFSGSSLPRILEVSRRWHGGLPAIEAALLAHPADDAGWGSGFPDHAEDGLDIRVLLDGRALAEESSRSGGLDHCGATYVGECRKGRIRLASVGRIGHDGARERLSTVELVMGDDGSPTVAQHRGRRNGPPPRIAVAFVARYASLLADGTLRIAPGQLFPMPGAREDASGYEFASPGAFEAVTAAWDPLLPRRLRGLDHDGWVDAARTAHVADGKARWSPTPVLPCRRTGMGRTPGADGPSP